MTSRSTYLALALALPALAFGAKELRFELTRSEGAAVEADARALSGLRDPMTVDLSRETVAVFDEAFVAMGHDDTPDADVHVQLWPPMISICAEPEDGYATCCTLTTSDAYCNNSSAD